MVSKNRRNDLISNVLSLNWTFIGLLIGIVCFGFVILYSAAEGNFYPWASKQITRFIIYFPIMIIIALVDIRFWLKYAYVIYGIVLVLLILVHVPPFGVTAMGATRWVQIGPFNAQPSEMMKVSLVFALARYFHFTSMANTHRVAHLIIPLLMIGAPVILTLIQPDLGTAVIMVMVSGALFFVAGVKIWKFLLVGGIGLALLPIAWHEMHDYQKKRVLIFMDPNSDPLGAGYNVLQSKIAIGSGGFSGKGFLEGTQNQLNFLPEKQTDFIFTMLAEEFGFLGGVSVILVYGGMIAYGMVIASQSSNHFGRMLGMGMICVLSVHVFVNIAMVMGLVPVVGVPLPFLSYGGTMLMTMMTAMGLILNVHLHSDQVLPHDTGIVSR